MGSTSRSFSRPSHPAAPLALLVMVLATALALFLAPVPAHARSYSIDRVDIDLTVNADGSIDVVEARTFDFDGSFNGVYWDIATSGPQVRSSSNPVELTVASVEDVTAGTAELTQSSSGANDTYQLIDEGSGVTRVKIFAAHEDESATIRIAYRLTNVANAWADTGELYWKFVSDGWEVPSDNVTCRVHLPVPTGQSVVAGDNVRAWGHGPLDATVSFDGNDVVYDVPGVGTDEYAEARITFPTAWLTGVAPSTASRLDSILSEESSWADAANAKREQARMAIRAASVAGFGVPVVMLVVGVLKWHRYKARHRPQFQDEYYRDVPSPTHPAALGCLYRGGSVSGELFTATLMRLTDANAISLEVLRDGRGRETDYLVRRGGSAPDDAIDRAAASLLFDVVAPRAEGGSPDWLRFSDVSRVAKRHAEEYAGGIEAWRSEVRAACERDGYFADPKGSGRAGLIVATVLLGFVSMLAAILLAVSGAIWQFAVSLALAVVAAAVCVALAVRMRSISPDAVELVAKLRALKRWLHDFTLLKEAVPRDVVLWNRLLVMAVVLGEAERVIEQLRTAAPEVLSDPGFYYGYCWYHGYGRLGSPAAAMSHAYDEAHTISAAELSSSSMSSGGGFGGGFSGGGGGGGGGGAF